MTSVRSLFDLLCLLCFMGGLITIIGLVLYWLDNWLDGDIAREQAEYNE